MHKKNVKPKINMDAAYISLMSAIQSYFETYRAISLENPSVVFSNQTTSIKNMRAYQCAYITSVTHFQHFFELIIKDMLKQLNEIECKKKRGGFCDALKELLIKKRRSIPKEILKVYNILLCHLESLKMLNTKRNKIWHQGLIKEDYLSYDFFIGHEILPLVKKIFDTSIYSGEKKLWYYKKLSCGKDPIEKIAKEFEKQKQDVDYEKIALLKEMGRAAYQNPLVIVDDRDQDNVYGSLRKSLIRRINDDNLKECSAKVDAMGNTFDFCDVDTCPVCGQKTLVSLSDAADDDFSIPIKMTCQTCSFGIYPNIKNNLWQLI